MKPLALRDRDPSGEADAYCISFPLLDLPSRGLDISAAVRVGDHCLWSPWSDFGASLRMIQPAVSSAEGCVTASPPLNRKVSLDWSALSCSLGDVPIESLATLQKLHTQKEEALLLGCCSGTFQITRIRKPHDLLHAHITVT